MTDLDFIIPTTTEIEEYTKLKEEIKKKDEKELEMKHQKMSYYIEKYYTSKTSQFRSIIKELYRERTKVGGVVIGLVGGFTGISTDSSEEEIKNDIKEKLSDREFIEDEEFGFIDKYSGKYVVKLYEDIQKFYDFFSTKGINATYKEILSEFKKNVDKEDFKKQVDSYFYFIEDGVKNRKSEHEIIKEFINYIIEDDDDVDINNSLFKGRLQNRYFKYVPPLLTKFGISYNGKIGNLRNIFNKVIDILILENVKKQKQELETFESDFESELDSSYDNLLKEDKDIDDDLLSDYLDDDFNDDD